MILAIQGPPDWSNGSPLKFNPEPCISCIPIDVGAWILIIVGLVFGFYFMWREAKKYE